MPVAQVVEGLPGQVIAVNMAFKLPHDLWFVGSRRLIDLLRLRKVIGLAGAFSIDSATYDMRGRYKPASFAVTDEPWGTTVEEGLPLAGCSGTMAINVADILGAVRIYLLGFDMRGAADGLTANWHREYPRSMRPPGGCYDTYCRDLAERAPHIRAEVINCTPGSALECFRRMELAECL